MERTNLVKLYNRLSWYFSNGVYPKVETKVEDSCETLIKELDELYKEENTKNSKEK